MNHEMLNWATKMRWLACAFVFITNAHSQVEKIGHIQHTPREEAATGVPVKVQAQVAHFHPLRPEVYIFDGDRGIHVHLPTLPGNFEGMKIGSWIEVIGVTSADNFVPDIIAEKITLINEAPPPKLDLFYYDQVYLPTFELHCRWVLLWGRVVDIVAYEDHDYIVLKIQFNDTTVAALVPKLDGTLEKLQPLMFKRINVPAVTRALHNNEHQMTGRIFLVNSAEDFKDVATDERAVDEDIRPIEALMHVGTDILKAMHTQGIVTQAEDNSIYLRGAKKSLKVSIFEGTRLNIGDYVDVVGYIHPQPISPAFRARGVTVLEKKAPPEPKQVDLGNNLDPNWCYELIQTEAVLVEIGKTTILSQTSGQRRNDQIDRKGHSILCRSGDRVFEARVPLNFSKWDELEPGSTLRLTGICNLIANHDPRRTHFIKGAWLELRSGDGIQVIKPASWWNPKRLATAVTTILVVASLFMVWNVLLRKTVKKQTKVISDQIEQETTQKERQRIARELHDTLEQSLGGMSFQLQNCSKLIDQDLRKSKDSLNLALGMLRHCREESRGSILDLRGGLLEKMDLPSALKESTQALADECGAALSVTVIGRSRRLSYYAERHLFRMAKEAVTNAARHASPQNICLELQYSSSSLSLTIIDDGLGFDVEQLNRNERFGLQGMRERANRIHAEFHMESKPGEGTTIRIDLPSTEKWERT